MIKTGSYTGNGGTNRAIPHSIGEVPGLCIVARNANASQYAIFGSDPSNLHQLASATNINTTMMDSVNFYVSGNANTNAQVYYWSCEGNSTSTISISLNVSTSTSMTADGISQVYAFGIFAFILMLFFFKDIFKVERYDQ